MFQQAFLPLALGVLPHLASAIPHANLHGLESSKRSPETIKPQIVLVPGAWHIPAHAAILTGKLEDAGYTVHSRQLPSVGGTPEDLTEDINTVQDLVTEAIGYGNDVIVVPHSWSGIVIGSALEGFGKKEREANGKKGGVVKLGYMAAFLVDEGISVIDTVVEPPSWWDIDPPIVTPTNPTPFYSDLPPEEQQYWFSLLQPQSYASFTTKSSGAAWKEIPISYLLTEADQALPPEAQEEMIQNGIELGGDITVRRINSSHSPFLSHPDEVVDWINDMAGGEC